MEGLWCNAVLLHLILVSCALDPHCDQQAQGRDANGSESQRHPGFSSTIQIPQEIEKILRAADPLLQNLVPESRAKGEVIPGRFADRPDTIRPQTAPRLKGRNMG